jgi:hypothetical protein
MLRDIVPDSLFIRHLASANSLKANPRIWEFELCEFEDLYRIKPYPLIGNIMPFTIELDDKQYYHAGMNDLSFKSIDELQVQLGQQIQALRISRNLNQITTAEIAGISEKALRNLEAGRGSTLESFLRVLKALDSLDGLELLVPKSSVSPLARLRSSKVRQRVRQSSASRLRTL